VFHKDEYEKMKILAKLSGEILALMIASEKLFPNCTLSFAGYGQGAGVLYHAI